MPLKSIYAYGDTGKQEARVTSLGWRQAEARSLWEMWSDDAVVPQAERKRLDTVEPFDEWEDFHLFASHYMLLHASNRDGMTCELRLERVQPQSPGSLGPRGAKLSVRHHTPDTSVTEPHRRHAAGAALRAGSNCFGFPEPLVVNLLGTGSKRPLLPTMDVHSMMGQVFGPGPDQAMVHEVNKIGGVPSARTHHATCDLERAGTLLVGGRAPSGEALRDCWLLIASQVVDGHKEGGCWQRTHDLPIPLYRHTLAAIGGYSEASVTSKGKPRPEAIVMGGKTTSGRVSAECFVFDHVAGWRRTRVEGDDEHRRQVFGATLWSFPGSNIPANKWQGLLIGGLRDDGTFSAMPVLGWQLEPQADSDAPKIKFMEALATERKRTASNLNRFGAVCIVDPEAGSAVMVGGMTQQGLCPKEAEVVIFEQLGPGSDLSWNANVHEMCLPSGVPRPLLSGISLACPKKGLYVMMGGGTAGGSFGTLWNSGTYTIVRADDDETTGSHTPDGAWKLCRTLDMSTKLEERVMEERVLRGGLVTAVRRVKLDQTASFEEILHGGQPVIFEGLDLGTCVDRWSTAYLVGKIGRDKKVGACWYRPPAQVPAPPMANAGRKVVVHKATTEKMDFNAKNFQYVTTEFGRFLDEVDAGGKQYLRALSVDKPAESPANLAHDFPEISDDFVLPASLDFVTRNLFSSVLRISGPVHMWLHYDVGPSSPSTPATS